MKHFHNSSYLMIENLLTESIKKYHYGKSKHKNQAL